MQIANTDVAVNIGETLNTDQRNQLSELFKRKLNVFSINGQLGQTDLIEHDIELLESARPNVEPLRRRPQLHKDETRKQVKQMLQQGVIEKSQSPWASAYVVVKKKTGDLRICIDFRKLNLQTKKCSYPLPNVEDCLQRVGGNKIFS